MTFPVPDDGGGAIYSGFEARLDSQLTSWEAHRALPFALRTFGVAAAETVRLAELPMYGLGREIGAISR